jgi:hypothetical protein
VDDGADPVAAQYEALRPEEHLRLALAASRQLGRGSAVRLSPSGIFAVS